MFGRPTSKVEGDGRDFLDRADTLTVNGLQKLLSAVLRLANSFHQRGQVGTVHPKQRIVSRIIQEWLFQYQQRNPWSARRKQARGFGDFG
jgi:hypothetical protein